MGQGRLGDDGQSPPLVVREGDHR
ncbi:MAG: hypothetical protein R3F59_11310 [Myxococcota bacterium]